MLTAGVPWVSLIKFSLVRVGMRLFEGVDTFILTLSFQSSDCMVHSCQYKCVLYNIAYTH